MNVATPRGGSLLRSLIASAALLLTIAPVAMAQGKNPGVKLAQETIQLLSTQESMLVTAIRQKDTRGGGEDFRRFIIQPLESMADRWRALPREERMNYIHCITALQEFENHASDSFKSGQVGQPTNLFKESRAECKKR